MNGRQSVLCIKCKKRGSMATDKVCPVCRSFALARNTTQAERDAHDQSGDY